MKQFLADIADDIFDTIKHSPLAAAVLFLGGLIVGWLIGVV